MQLKFKKYKFNMLLPRILDFIQTLDEDKEYRLEIKKEPKTRSLVSNNYSWALTDQLSDVLVLAGVKLSKEEMHAEMIFRYGQVLLDDNGEQVIYSSCNSIPLPEVYPYAKEIGESELNGKVFKHFRIYRGSHTYDTREMAIFISGIVEECREQGIDVDTPDVKALLESQP